MPRLAVIAHRSDGFWKRPYVLQTLIEVWESWGIEVVLADSPGRTIDADLAFLHVDGTFVPPEYLALAASYPRCINRYTADISKRFISRHIVAKRDDYDGPVIVKSNFNSGGWIEANARSRSDVGSASARPLPEYTVFDRIEQVPEEVWLERSFVVEKFLPEIDQGLHCLRAWFFLGDADFGSIKYSTEKIVKGRNVVKRDQLHEVPDELRQIRQELGFDYGKFDYGIVDGKVVLYDANRTPGYLASNTQDAEPRRAALAPGIRDFLQF